MLRAVCYWVNGEGGGTAVMLPVGVGAMPRAACYWVNGEGGETAVAGKAGGCHTVALKIAADQLVSRRRLACFSCIML